MSSYAFTGTPQIISEGGNVYKNTFKAANSTHWAKGTLLTLSSGALTPCYDPNSGAHLLSTAELGSSGARLFVALSAHGAGFVDTANPMVDVMGVSVGEQTTSVYPADGYVPVQEILRKTVLEGPVCASSSGTGIAAIANINTTYAGYQLATGAWAVDIDSTSSPVFYILDVEPNYNPWKTTASSIYNKVRFSILASILQR